MEERPWHRSYVPQVPREIRLEDITIPEILSRIARRYPDRIALLLPNIPQIVITYFGAWRAGLVPVPVNPLYTGHEIEHQLETSGATATVALDLVIPRMLALKRKTKNDT